MAHSTRHTLPTDLTVISRVWIGYVEANTKLAKSTTHQLDVHLSVVGNLGHRPLQKEMLALVGVASYCWNMTDSPKTRPAQADLPQNFNGLWWKNPFYLHHLLLSEVKNTWIVPVVPANLDRIFCHFNTKELWLLVPYSAVHHNLANTFLNLHLFFRSVALVFAKVLFFFHSWLCGSHLESEFAAFPLKQEFTLKRKFLCQGSSFSQTQFVECCVNMKSSQKLCGCNGRRKCCEPWKQNLKQLAATRKKNSTWL